MIQITVRASTYVLEQRNDQQSFPTWWRWNLSPAPSFSSFFFFLIFCLEKIDMHTKLTIPKSQTQRKGEKNTVLTSPSHPFSPLSLPSTISPTHRRSRFHRRKALRLRPRPALRRAVSEAATAGAGASSTMAASAPCSAPCLPPVPRYPRQPRPVIPRGAGSGMVSAAISACAIGGVVATVGSVCVFFGRPLLLLPLRPLFQTGGAGAVGTASGGSPYSAALSVGRGGCHCW